MQGVSESRGLPQAAVEAAIDEAPLTAQRAVALKLLDAAKYRRVKAILKRSSKKLKGFQ